MRTCAGHALWFDTAKLVSESEGGGAAGLGSFFVQWSEHVLALSRGGDGGQVIVFDMEVRAGIHSQEHTLA